MLIVTGTITVPPSDMPRFVAEVGDLATSTRHRAGNLSYDTAVLDAASGRLLVAERWRDEATLAAHLQSDDTAAFISRWHERMLSDVCTYDVGNEHSLMTT